MLSLCEVAVGAFKVAIELEVKRRDNDKKIDLLFLEMRNMMHGASGTCVRTRFCVPAGRAMRDDDSRPGAEGEGVVPGVGRGGGSICTARLKT